ncbi:MAG: c-type cytochrome [Paracoccaceae bacterium]|nr:c-type cytochrome [Paracoccaceae bacterium]
MKPLMITAIGLALTVPAVASAQDVTIGAALFNQYCSTCHGADARGEGPLTEIMLEKPSDLRKLAAENPAEPGVFPMLRVIHVIDGRTGLRAHGGSMPTYGQLFMAETEDEMEEMGAILETRGRVLSLARYLEDIQE